MEDKCEGGGVTGEGKAGGFVFFKEFRLRSYAFHQIGIRDQVVAHHTAVLHACSGMESDVTNSAASAASRNVPMVPVCQEILSDRAEKAKQLGEPIIMERRGVD